MGVAGAIRPDSPKVKELQNLKVDEPDRKDRPQKVIAL